MGYSLAIYLAEKGHKCLIVDTDSGCTARINSGQTPFGYAGELLSPVRPETLRNIRASDSGECALTDDHSIHFLCIPTQSSGKISSVALQDVVSKIASRSPQGKPVYILIESTVSPRWIDTVVHNTFQNAGWVHKRDYHIGCSPRRDVFGRLDRSLADVAKIFGADSEECAALMRDIYGPLSRDLYQASDAKHAALTKIVENLFRYQAIMLANQLVHLMPEFNIAEVLSLAATKWNMDHYHPSLGIGGYCVPLAKEYLADSLDEAKRTTFAAYSSSERVLAQEFMQQMLEIWPMKKVVVLGLSYAPGLKVHTLAPSLRLVEFLKSRGCEIKVHDPYYTSDEINRLTGAESIERFADLVWADTVVLMTAHNQYLGENQKELVRHLSPTACVFDSTGKWEDQQFPRFVRYVQVGGRGFYRQCRVSRV